VELATPPQYINKYFYIFVLLSLGGGVALTPLALQQHIIGFMNEEVMNLLHFPAFLLIALFIPKSHLISTKAIWLLLPIAIELLQLVVGRTCDILDAIWGIYAVLCGLAWKSLRWYMRSLCLVPYLIAVSQFVIISLYPLGHLPIVSNMESRLSMAQIKNVGEMREKTIDQYWSESKNSSVLVLSKQNYPWTGIRVNYPWGVNLSDYRGLKFYIKTKDAPFRIDVKIASDEEHKIITKTIKTTSWTEILVDFDKENSSLDWSEVDYFAVYYFSESGPEHVELDSVRYY
jgi:hypothetical protein